MLNGAAGQRSNVFRLRDGSFIFNVRSIPECKNLTVIRADKLLLKVAISRQLFGVQEYGVTEVKFREMLGHYGVHYIVIEPDFWADLKSMQMLVGLLHQRQFQADDQDSHHE